MVREGCILAGRTLVLVGAGRDSNDAGISLMARPNLAVPKHGYRNADAAVSRACVVNYVVVIGAGLTILSRVV